MYVLIPGSSVDLEIPYLFAYRGLFSASGRQRYAILTLLAGYHKEEVSHRYRTVFLASSPVIGSDTFKRSHYSKPVEPKF